MFGEFRNDCAQQRQPSLPSIINANHLPFQTLKPHHIVPRYPALPPLFQFPFFDLKSVYDSRTFGVPQHPNNVECGIFPRPYDTIRESCLGRISYQSLSSFVSPPINNVIFQQPAVPRPFSFWGSRNLGCHMTLPRIQGSFDGFRMRPRTPDAMLPMDVDCSVNKRPRLIAPKMATLLSKSTANHTKGEIVEKSEFKRQPLKNCTNVMNQRPTKHAIYRHRIWKNARRRKKSKKRRIVTEENAKTRCRKPREATRSAERCDPNFRGAIVWLKTQMKDEDSYLKISAHFWYSIISKNA